MPRSIGAGLAIVVPQAVGDLAESFARECDPKFRLERPDRQAFEGALVKLGIERSDAERLAQTSGRSWSVIRRHHATNPAIYQPTWLTNEQAWALSTLCLVGSWNSNTKEDQKIVARIAGRPYEEIERALAGLATLDDSPVLRIGNI